MSKLAIGFGRADITPPNGLFISGYYSERRGQGCLDDLKASVLAFSDGEKTAVVFTLDVIGIDEEFGDRLRGIVAERTGLPYEAVYYACTHTHTAPAISSDLFPIDPEYNSVMFRKCADVAAEAIADMSAAEVFTARGTVEDISFIRRFKMKNGKTQTNPGHGNPEIDHPISTPDESLQLVRIVREGKDDLVIVNFQVHPDVVSGSYYSSDWPGFVRRTFEGAVPGTKCLFFNGAQGDTNHFNPLSGIPRRSGYNHARHMGMCIAGEAMKLYTYAEKAEGDTVGFAQVNLEVPSNRGTADDLVLAEKYIALHEAGRESEIPYTGMEYVTAVARAYLIKQLEFGPDSFTLYLNAVRFGDVVFAGVPGEPFTDIGRGIKEGSPFGMTIVCCCANGYEGYYPMQSAYDEGGYEANSSKFTAGIAERIIDGSVAMLKELY
ncbi:MAG: hypothetical protein J6N32_07955 [Clostridia bacterium]|nr:hypothetical protein [Clostridia bacterium]